MEVPFQGDIKWWGVRSLPVKSYCTGKTYFFLSNCLSFLYSFFLSVPSSLPSFFPSFLLSSLPSFHLPFPPFFPSFSRSFFLTYFLSFLHWSFFLSRMDEGEWRCWPPAGRSCGSSGSKWGRDGPETSAEPGAGPECGVSRCPWSDSPYLKHTGTPRQVTSC